MELKRLFSGIAVVIDDALDEEREEAETKDLPPDRIVEIVRLLKTEWNLPCYVARTLPDEGLWRGLMESASFVLLDWQLWPSTASELKAEMAPIRDRFLRCAQDHFVPVLIFSNESEERVRAELPEGVLGRAPVFIQSKVDVLREDSLDFRALTRWVESEASVYVLKTWERELQEAKKDLFSSLYSRKADWPKVFWKSFERDEVEPGAALMGLINDNLRGRIRIGVLDPAMLSSCTEEPSTDELQALIGEASCQSRLCADEVRCGDLFQLSERKYLLNLTPDCDCIPRGGQTLERVRLRCIEGATVDDSELAGVYRDGHFEERVWEYLAFCVCNGMSVRFSFRKLQLKRFGEVRASRIGRLMHPYLTRVQQRFAQYSQRQGLPRIPEAAVPVQTGADCCAPEGEQ